MFNLISTGHMLALDGSGLTIGSNMEENVIKGQSIRCHLDRGQNSGWGWLVLEGTHWVHSFGFSPSDSVSLCMQLQCASSDGRLGALPTHTGHMICETVASARYSPSWNAAEMVLLLILGGLLHSCLILAGPRT